MSAIYDYAAQLWAEMRADYGHHRDAEFARAHEDTRGNMLSPLGRAQGIDPRDLWALPESHARRYASTDLCLWWDTEGRSTLATYEPAWFDGRRYGTAVVA